MFLKRCSTSRCIMCDAIILSISVHYRCIMCDAIILSISVHYRCTMCDAIILSISVHYRCIMCDAIILSISVHYRCPTIPATATLSHEEARENATHVWPREERRHKLIVLSPSEAKKCCTTISLVIFLAYDVVRTVNLKSLPSLFVSLLRRN